MNWACVGGREKGEGGGGRGEGGLIGEMRGQVNGKSKHIHHTDAVGIFHAIPGEWDGKEMDG